MTQLDRPGSSVHARRSGFAYVAVLLMVTVLVVLGLSFLSRAGIGTSATLQRGSTMQAEYLAEAAANHGMWKLLNVPGFPPAEDRYYMHSLAGGRYGYMVKRHTGSTYATVATVGAVGESVVRRSYVLHMRYTGGPAQMVSGTYTGNAQDNRAIGGVGFRPDVVIIKGNVARVAVIRTPTMLGDLTKPMQGATAAAANMIQSLDGSGFTIGSSVIVNTNAVNYYWAAFRVIEGQMEVGTYTGDDSDDRAFTGMCFRPALVIVFGASNTEAVFRLDYSPETFDFGNGGKEDKCILDPFLDDGFRVGKSDRVNKSGRTYHYVCWPSIPGQQASGGYVGNDVDNRNITGLGFAPEYVMVRCVSSGNDAMHRTASLGVTGNSMYYKATVLQANRIQALLADGFQVGTDNDVNNVGDSYAYFAWAKK